jgi:hypothetical protein
MIPPYFAARQDLWRDKNLKPTNNWDEAEFLWEAGEFVRIAKPGSFDELLFKLRDYQ